MYLSNIKLWNFRKYGLDSDLHLTNGEYLEKPHLDLNFTKGLNVLIGANDSGKTAILDAIKLVLKTNSYEWIRIQDDDFYNKKATKFRIELSFNDLNPNFSRFFVEHLTVDGEGEEAVESLNLIFEVSRNKERIFPSDVKAGLNGELGTLSAEQRELLNVTYLKPLRDVKTEFIPKKGSRLSNILDGHKAFKGKGERHELYKIFEKFNTEVENYFVAGVGGDLDGIELKKAIDKYIEEFLDKGDESNFSVNPGELRSILEKLELTLKKNINPGLGSLNRLFIASELLHLQREKYDGLDLGLIEEIEAHIHPQAQMKVIESLQKRIDKDTNGIQLIITTHSPNLASKVKLENLIICKNNWAFPMGQDYTELGIENYRFLERFLDVTKSNLFFSEGVILVEGWAEEIILPIFSKLLKKLEIIDKDLIESQTEIVNVGSDTFTRYAKIFERKAEPYMSKNIAIVTDIDLRPDLYKSNLDTSGKTPAEEKAKWREKNIISEYSQPEIDTEREKKNIEVQNIKTYITDNDKWTLEYSLGLFPKFQQIFYKSVLFAFKEKQSYLQASKIAKLKKNMEEDFETNFASLGSTDIEISFSIYNQLLGNEPIVGMAKTELSKTIVAQYFAEFLEDEINHGTLGIVASDFDSSSISYLINAIKHATNQ